MEIEVALEGIKKDVEYMRERMDEFVRAHEKLDERVTKLENWKLVFVAKFAAYSTIGLVVGSFSAQLLLKFLSKYI